MKLFAKARAGNEFAMHMITAIIGLFASSSSGRRCNKDSSNLAQYPFLPTWLLPNEQFAHGQV